MDLSQHLTLMVNDFGHLAGGINFPHKLSRIKGTQVSAILCTESLLPLQTVCRYRRFFVSIKLSKKHKRWAMELDVVIKMQILLAFFMAICYNKCEKPQ